MLRSRTPARLRPARTARKVGAAALAVGTMLALTPSGASAYVEHSVRHKVIDIAAAQNGDRYVYGGDGPDEFDCSGLTQYAYGKVGKYLPHKASLQVGYTTRVSKSDRWHGDLVFFYDSSGYVYHVAIYAGDGYIWHAPNSRETVKKEKLWTDRVFYGHVK